MFGKHFELNEHTIHIVEDIGRHMPGGFFIYRSGGDEELLYANKSVCSLYGCETLSEFRELTGYTFRGMVLPEDYEELSESISKQMDASEEKIGYAEYHIRRKDGTVRYVDGHGHFTDTLAYGGIYYVFISDITEKKEREEHENRKLVKEVQAEQARRIEQDKMITALASDYRSVYHVDLDNNDAVCYRADPEDDEQTREWVHFPYLERFGWYADHSIDENFREAFLDFISADNIRKGLAKSSVISYCYLVHRKGKHYYEMIKIASIPHDGEADDGIIHAVCLGLTDIDEDFRNTMMKNQALIEALVAAENANNAKTAFLSSMSHEIRTPMNAIIGLNSIALKDTTLSDQTRGYLEKIGESAGHLLHLINDILDMSRIESGRMTLHKEEFNLSAMLDQITTMVQSQCRDKGLDFESKIIGELDDWYFGDDMKLKQVIINILSNAIKFTEAPGSIFFTIEKVAYFERQSTLRFIIRDTGIGMDEEYLPKIFDAFTQEDSSRSNKYGSTGLGMAITKSIVEMMNGTISVQSKKGEGSTFTVNVTLKNCEKGERDITLFDPSRIKALVIDDDEVALEHAGIVLEDIGVSADTASSGSEALVALEIRQAKHEPYNLVIVDWKMPDMSGEQVTREIRRRYGNDARVIALTAYDTEDIMEEARLAGVDSFISKSEFPSVIGRVLEKVMKKPDTAGKKLVSLDGKRILLAEDMPINAEIMKQLLSIKGIEADHAENGQIALETFRDSEPHHYEAVLMDVRMPVMDGLETAAAIRALDRDDARSIPIIALTANAFDEDVQRSLQAGMNAHLSKPVEPEQLYHTLEELISRNG